MPEQVVSQDAVIAQPTTTINPNNDLVLDVNYASGGEDKNYRDGDGNDDDDDYGVEQFSSSSINEASAEQKPKKKRIRKKKQGASGED